jgi:hypothetical protein
MTQKRAGASSYDLLQITLASGVSCRAGALAVVRVYRQSSELARDDCLRASLHDNLRASLGRERMKAFLFVVSAIGCLMAAVAFIAFSAVNHFSPAILAPISVFLALVAITLEKEIK